jgi:hypothetical protein
LAIVVSSRESCCAKQPSPRATMAALWATRAAASYTTPWDTIRPQGPGVADTEWGASARWHQRYSPLSTAAREIF